MGTLRDIQLRLKAVRNIGKITASMKMIAATRLGRATRAMDAASVFGDAAGAALRLASCVPERQVRPGPADALVALSSDRGLCGAIHSGVARAALAAEGGPRLVVVGDKARAQLVRGARERLALSFSGAGRRVPSIADAVGVWAEVERLAPPIQRPGVVRNRFVSAIAHETTVEALPAADDAGPIAEALETDGDSFVPSDCVSFAATARLFSALVEAHVAELSARRAAMENATKNAEEMVADLSLSFNRTRQAVITNELVDIIVGASAL